MSAGLAAADLGGLSVLMGKKPTGVLLGKCTQHLSQCVH